MSVPFSCAGRRIRFAKLSLGFLAVGVSCATLSSFAVIVFFVESNACVLPQRSKHLAFPCLQPPLVLNRSMMSCLDL